MSKENDPAKYTIKGNDLICPMCRNEWFYVRRYEVGTEQSWDWGFFGTMTETYICAECGYVCWFVPTEKLR